jgi:hypothetical protein
VTRSAPSPRSDLFRIATWFVGVALLAALIVIVAGEFGEVEQNEDVSIEGLLEQMRTAGLPVGKVAPLADSLGAARAVEVQVAGSPVHLYHFNALDPTQFATLEKIRTRHSVDEAGGTVPALANGSFVLTRYEKNPQQEDLVNNFKGFGTFEGIDIERKIEQ